MNQKPEDVLPPLREDLRILRAAPLPSGAPGWVIFDPVRYLYVQVGRSVLEMLGAWQAGSAAGLSETMRSTLGREPGPGEVEALHAFLEAHELVEPKGGGRALAERQARRRHHWLTSLVHNYLFFRIPLVRPQALLDRTRWVGDALFSPAMLAITLLAALVGGFLVVRQWDTFVATGLSLLSLEGAAIFAVALPLVKTLHELGHAYMATRYGVRVPSMGVAFMVLAPFLYSDVTDAWRLASRRQRLAIDAAGLLVELMLAAFGLLLWVFLAPGPLRSAVFVFATTSLAMGLLLNLNPFMRFDGYHILADAVGMPNLQTRSIAVGKWFLRELLFGIGAPCPERLPRSTVAAMAIYAYAIWIYRFTLFLGIALLVYHMAFKALGIILFLIEIVWFILLPVVLEIQRWWRGRAMVARQARAWITLSLMAGIVVLAFVPLRTSVSLPVVASARGDATLYAPSPARIVAVGAKEGQEVAAGQVLLRLTSPDLEAALAREQIQMERVELRLSRVAAVAQDRSELRVLEQEKDSILHRVEGLRQQLADLEIRSPIAGRVRDLDPALRTGMWVNQKTALAHVVSDGPPELRGYVAEADLHRLAPGAPGRFLPDDPLRPKVAVRLESVSATAAESVDIPALASVHDGPVPVAATSGDQALRPLTGQYSVVLSAEDGYHIDQAVRGQAWIEGSPESFASRIARRVVGVLIRESGA